MLRSKDIVISYASEDTKWVRCLTCCLKKRNITYYDYQDYDEEQIGRKLQKLTDRIYNTGGYVAVIICSKNYIEQDRKFLNQEYEIIKEIHNRKEHYLYVLSVDGTSLNQHIKLSQPDEEIGHISIRSCKDIKQAADQIATRVRKLEKTEYLFALCLLISLFTFVFTSYSTVRSGFNEAVESWNRQWHVSTSIENAGNLTGAELQLFLHSHNQIIEITNAKVEGSTISYTLPYTINKYDTLNLLITRGVSTDIYKKNFDQSTFRISQ